MGGLLIWGYHPLFPQGPLNLIFPQTHSRLANELLQETRFVGLPGRAK